MTRKEEMLNKGVAEMFKEEIENINAIYDMLKNFY